MHHLTGAELIHQVDSDLQSFITEQYVEELGPDIDIWCPDEPLSRDFMPWRPLSGGLRGASRPGKEDYEYFIILDGRGEKAWVDDVMRQVAPKTYLWEHDWDKLLDWRRKVAEKILGTLDEIPLDPPTGLDVEGQVESIRLTWTEPDDADLAGYDVWYGIYDGDEFFGGVAWKQERPRRSFTG